MFPILYNANETDFIHNGLGLLTDAIKAVATEELNGMFELQIEYDSEGFLVDEIKEEMIIKAKANDKQDEQLFRIYSITKNHKNDNLIIDAQHITYDLANNFVEKLEARSLTKKQVMEKIGASTAYSHPFNMTSSNTITISSTSIYRTNPLQMVGGIEGSVLQIWGGQIERDNFNLIMHDRRGSDDGVLVTYRKNLTGLNAVFDISDVVTRIYPFVFKEEENKLITVAGNYVDSPLINDYEQVFIQPIDYSSDERIDTQDKTDAQIRQQLTNLANVYFNETGNDKAKVSMEVKFEHLWETEEYKHLAVLELVGMGDTVTIQHSKLMIEASAIVNRIEYDCIARKNIAVDVGSVKAKLTDSVNKIDDVAEKVEQAEQSANQAIKTANGKNTIYYGPDEPTGNLMKDDIWFKVVDGEYTRTYRFDGIQWQLVMDMDTDIAKQQAQQAKNQAAEAVANANLATRNATDAINKAQEGFDKAQDALTTAGNASTQANSAFTTANDAFNNVTALSTKVDDQTGEISTIKQSVKGLQTSVADAQGNASNALQIATGLQTTVSDIKGNVSTLQQTATNLTSRIDNLKVGGRNLIPDSKNIRLRTNNNTTYPLTVTKLENDVWELLPIDGVGISTYFPTLFGDFYDIDSTEYSNDYHILSVEVMSPMRRTVRLTSGDTYILEPNKWTRIERHYPNGLTNSTRPAGIRSDDSHTPAQPLYYRNYMFTRGSKAPEGWQPAPEDVDHKFSVINQTIDSIATRIQDAEGNVSTLTQTAQGLQNRVADAEGNISTVTQLANTLQRDLRDAEGNINTLTETASSMQRTISDLPVWKHQLPRASQANPVELTYPDGRSLRDNVAYEIYLSARAGTSANNYSIYTYERGILTLRDRSGTGTDARLVLNNGKVMVETHYSNTTQSYPYTATVTEYDGIGARSIFTQLSNNINARVEKGDVINQLNISTEGILIDGKKVHITGQTKIDNAAIKSAAIQSLDAGKITVGTLDAGKISVINLSANSIVGGILSSQNDNMTLNMNTGRLHMQRVNFTLGNGADIEFLDVGNRLYYKHYDPVGNITRSAGFGVGQSISDRFPYAFLGTTNTSKPHPRDQDNFTGFIANTNQRMISDGIGNSVIGRIFHVRDKAVSFDSGFEFDVGPGTNRFRPMNAGSNTYWIGASNNQFDGAYIRDIRSGNGFIRFRNSASGYTNQGFTMETTYGSDKQLHFRGTNTGDYWNLGKPGGWRFSYIYLNYQPDTSSDERLKENIQPNQLGLDFINDIETKSFKLINNNPNLSKEPMQYGVIAQQLKSTLVKHNVDTENINMLSQGEDGMYGVQYTQLIPPTIKAVQEIDLKVNHHIEDTALKFAELEERINKLEVAA